MTYEIYRYIFLGGAILAAIMAVVSAIVFFVLKIPTVIGDLTGTNARKAIANIRNQNARADETSYRTSQINRERGKITDKMSPSGRVIQNPSHNLHGTMGTEKIGVQQLVHGNGANETTVLTEAQEGTIVQASIPCGNETTLLADESYVNETTVLQPVSNVFVLEYELTYIHTDERIG